MIASVRASAPSFTNRAESLLAAHNDRVRRRTDRLFGALMLAEWAGCVLCALIVSPRQWAGAEFGLHVHVCVAVLLGGAIVAIPASLALFAPGAVITRHSVAAGQMLLSVLLIHLTGGRIESHFFIFGSLAFLAFYRDWRVLVTATLVTGADHFLGGLFFPQSAYGVLGGAEWRFMEHAGWVVFENLFLGASCIEAQREMKEIASRQEQLETSARVLAETGEEALQLAARNEQLAVDAQAATRAKSEFLSTMSHELRTPMNAIINYADLAVRRGAKAIALTPEPAALQQQHRFASEIKTAGERLLSLINQLLDLSRIEAGKLEVHVEDASALDVIGRVRKIADSLIDQNQNAFTATCDPDLRFRTDVQKLEQCILNLVGNSAKFTQHGSITLEIRRAFRANPGLTLVDSDTDSDTDTDTMMIVVTDTGIGMTPEQLGRLFIPFNQADSSITREYGGSGLGLSITKAIVTLLGGTITVTSELNVGSTFTLTAPMCYGVPVEGRAVARSARSMVRASPERILVGSGRAS